MHYLIDGHNLIAKMQDISLDDPNDELKLVLRLKGWAAASRKRRVTVIFDGGLPGGPSLHFSNDAVRVVFASIGRSADALLISRIKRAKNPPEYTVVSSDREIISTASSRRMPHQRSEEFATELGVEKRFSSSTHGKPASSTKSDEPQVSEDELKEWLELFGPEPDTAPPKSKRRPTAPAKIESKPEVESPGRPSLTTDKTSEHRLSEREVDEWLRLFDSDENES
jgi:predicted RNA-binding protein with PIN domain